jgi:hypothetical protein
VERCGEERCGREKCRQGRGADRGEVQTGERCRQGRCGEERCGREKCRQGRGADRGGVERGDVEMGGEFCTSQKTVSDKWPIVFIDIDTIEIRSDEDPENSSITSRRSYNYKASH